MKYVKFGQYVLRAAKRYKHYLPFVVFLKLVVFALSAFLDPKNPKGPKSTKLMHAKLGPIANHPSKNQTSSSPYLGDEGKHELRKQVVNSLVLSTEHIPSRKFCLFAEQYLLSERIDFSFAKALPVSRLINKVLGAGYTHQANWSVLCIGCRDEIEIAFIKRYFQRLSGLKVTGLDISAVGEDVVEGDMHNMPFEDNKFDIIISCHSLEHCVEPTQVAKEIKRVAKRNAIIGIEVPVVNHNGTNPTPIEESLDNWDYCNPDVLCGLFNKDVKLLDQEILPKAIRVVMEAPSGQ